MCIKPTLDRNIPADVRAFAAKDAKFPHDRTANQWFTESRFESYRALGSFIIRHLGGSRSPDGQRVSMEAFVHAVEEYLTGARDKLEVAHPMRLVR